MGLYYITVGMIMVIILAMNIVMTLLAFKRFIMCFCYGLYVGTVWVKHVTMLPLFIFYCFKI